MERKVLDPAAGGDRQTRAIERAGRGRMARGVPPVPAAGATPSVRRRDAGQPGPAPVTVSPSRREASDLPAALEVLAREAARLGLALEQQQLDRFERLIVALRRDKARVSLTSLVDPVDIAVKHFLDSLTILLALPEGTTTLIDVGTGAGFPGLPLKIARPSLRCTLVEATEKKAAWVQQTAAELGLSNVEVLAARAEDVGHDPAYRGRFDVAAARAVAPVAVLCELCLPFVRPGGRLIAQKTIAGAGVEVPAAANALRVLGARLVEVRPVNSPVLPNRVLVVIEQIGHVPDVYPRRAGIPSKRPL